MNDTLRLALALLLLAGPAAAQNCADAQSQTDMDICAGQDFTKADAALNAVYKQLMAKITPAGQASLKKAEKSWLVYRDDQCAFNTLGSAGASVNPMVSATCKTALTTQQTAQLKAQLDCAEGDMSCGGQ
jgi:uncharacterized protein YecT (DUF1311 family)